ncbi:MAG: hypothetical protein ACTHJL_01805 [Amnibacterium sp.]
MQGVPMHVRQPALRVAVVPRRRGDVGRSLLAAAAAGLFFAAIADGLGVVLHLLGVMPLLP